MKLSNLSYLFALVTSALLTSCATMPSPELQAKQAEFQSTIPVCVGEADCIAKWEAAQLWVIHNAAFKIQTATNVLIETYNATGGNPRIAVRVTKEPMGGGQYKIVVFVTCDNLFGCVPNAWDAALDFNRRVGAITT